MTYTAHRDTQQTLAILDNLDLDADKLSEEELARKFGWEDDYHKGIGQHLTFIVMMMMIEKIKSQNGGNR